MKKRRMALIAGVAILLVGVVAPIVYIEIGCRPQGAAPAAARGASPAQSANYRPLLASTADQRVEARTYLTYPEWHIVYAAESYARFLQNHAPSGYNYGGDVRSFWTSTCAMNRVADPAAAGEAKVMVYTIGISFGFELAAKSLYENTIGRFSEWIGGSRSPADRYAQRVQATYGAFMHETPWYRFPFNTALSRLWQVPGGGLRQRERQIGLSGEYGVKSLYARLIGWASGATLGADEVVMRAVIATPAASLTGIDPRIRVLRDAPDGGTVVEVPRYAQFTQIAQTLAARGVAWREIAGNDQIMLTYHSAAAQRAAGLPAPLFEMPLRDQPGQVRRAVMVPVRDLSATLTAISASGATLEHIYDY